MGPVSRPRAVLIFCASMLVALAGAATADAAEVRLVHGVAGAKEAVLTISGKRTGTPVGFGQIGPYVKAPNGRVQLGASPASGGKSLGGGVGTLGPGRHTAIAWLRDGKFELSVIDDEAATPGKVRLRAVQAAGELGKARVLLDGRRLGNVLSPGDASAYQTVEPGVYKLQVVRASGGGAPLATDPALRLAAGSSETEFVFGTGGEPVKVVAATDATAGPAKAPQTGFGGLDGSSTPWLAVLLAALAAGFLGGCAYRFSHR